jgi:hypothetical protein
VCGTCTLVLYKFAHSPNRGEEITYRAAAAKG